MSLYVLMQLTDNGENRMRLSNKIKSLSCFVLLLTSPNAYTEDFLTKYTVYPFGGSFHFKTTKETNNGNLNYFAITKTDKKDAWRFENGIGTFIDTYHVRSYLAFSDITHDKYKYGMITPILSANCAYKGYKHSTKKRRLQCFPLLKFKLAKNKGLILKITPIPKFKRITNGQITFEIGYKF